MTNPVGVELKILYHWQNPKVINRFGVLNGMHSRASVQPTMKYRQARAPAQAPLEGQVDVQITNVKLVISELASKAGRDIGSK